MAKRDVVNAITWVLMWDGYLSHIGDSRLNCLRRGQVMVRRRHAIERLREVWHSSGHFWIDAIQESEPKSAT